MSESPAAPQVWCVQVHVDPGADGTGWPAAVSAGPQDALYAGENGLDGVNILNRKNTRGGVNSDRLAMTIVIITIWALPWIAVWTFGWIRSGFRQSR